MHHVICGQDADLIMLGLATHESRISILRETVIQKGSNCFKCGQPGHISSQCQGAPSDKEKSLAEPNTYQLLHTNILREYLSEALRPETKMPDFDVERAIDDWIFLCFLVGNDFLPHLPTLEIREGAINKLMDIYRKRLPEIGYLTDSGEFDVPRVQHFLTDIAKEEDNILKQRKEREDRLERNRKEKARRIRLGNGNRTMNSRVYAAYNQSAERREREEAEAMNEFGRNQAVSLGKGKRSQDEPAAQPVTNMSVADQLRQKLLAPVQEEPPQKKLRTVDAPAQVEPNSNSNSTPPEEEEEQTPFDPVRLGEDGWRERYYKEKFRVTFQDTEFIDSLAMDYLDGMQWVLKYYYFGCIDWNWYFPHHYAPFAAEMVSAKIRPPNFSLGTPFRPMEQLMAVLPALSGDFVPKPFRQLMTDPDSPIIDFYPEDFELDANGKKQPWLAVALLPWIDSQRLLKTLEPIYEKGGLTSEETIRKLKIHLEMTFV